MADSAGDPLAIEIIDRNAELKSERATWSDMWQRCADYVMPRKAEITEKKTYDVEGWTQDVYSFTAVRSNFVLAAGQLNYITPNNEIWGVYEPPSDQRENEEAKEWFSKCTEIAMEEIKRSNFYQEVHENYLNRGGLGTASLLVEEGTMAKPLVFKAHDTGTYSVAENSEGLIDTFFYEFEFSARQAVREYGEENVSKDIRDCYSSENGKNRSKKFKFIYAIFPREDSQRILERMDGENMPFAAVTVECKAKHVVRNSGFLEFPGGVTRYLKWGKAPYGYCPTVEALPLIRQVNFIEQQLDALAELAAFPRFLIPDSYEGEVDLRAGGGTIVSSSDMARGVLPQEWATQGRYEMGIDRVDRKKQDIEEAYHVDLFNALAVREKTMTATEVLEIVAEKLILFSPTFARLVTEQLNPVMKRVFSVLLRMGKFPAVPEGVIVAGADGEPEVPEPQVNFVSKVALATKAIENRSWQQFMQIIAGMLGMDPENPDIRAALDYVNFDKVVKGVSDNLGLPMDWGNTDDVVAAKRKLREQQAEAEAALQALEQGGKGAKDLSQADGNLLQFAS